MTFCNDYYWHEGIPKPIGDGKRYRVVSDPYHKWITIEKYRGDHLVEVVYDSHLLDFRSLKPLQQVGWRKEMIIESPNLVKQWLFNEDDRAILIEEMFYERGNCRKCRVLYPCGRLLTEHHLYYKSLKDPFNGVVLNDANAHPVMMRAYKDFVDGEWTELLQESWSLSPTSQPLEDLVAQT